MFDFQQLVLDLREDKILPSIPPKTNQIELLKISEKMLEEWQKKKAYPRELESPLGCQLELTHKCNLNCIHCYNQSGNFCQELSFKQWIGIAKQLVDMNIFECVISGGEPLLLKDNLYKIMSVLHDNGIKFIFVTNGMLLDENQIEKLSKYDYYWFQVSIDGSKPEIHDKIRGLRGSWKRAVNAAKLVSESGLPLVISHVIQRYNISYLDEMIETSYLLGARRIITGKFTYSGRAILNKDKIDVFDDELKEAFQFLQTKYNEYFGKMEIITSTDPVFYLRYRIIEPCNVILIRPNGDVKLDCVLPFKIGNVLNENLLDMWNRIGKNAWRNEEIIKYISSIKTEKDMLRIFPRPYIDKDILIR